MDKLCIVSYEDFISNTKQVMFNLDSFLFLTKPLNQPIVKHDCIAKWKTQLTDQEIMEIQEIVGFPPSELM